MTNLKFNQWELISHSLGIYLLNAKQSKRKKDKQLPLEFYRNYYCAGSSKISEFNELESLELVESWKKHFSQGSDLVYYRVTKKGQKEFREWFKIEITNKHKPLSKSKENYLNYLDSDGWESFSDFLNIWKPEYQRKNYFGEKIRMNSTNPRYRGLSGDWMNSEKMAKHSYKEKLKEAKKQEKETGYYHK